MNFSGAIAGETFGHARPIHKIMVSSDFLASSLRLVFLEGPRKNTNQPPGLVR